MKILNRLDYSSSPDTHDRFVAQHANNELTLSIWNELALQLTTLICCRAIQLSIVVINTIVTMEPQSR